MRTTRRDFLKTSSLIGLGASGMTTPSFLARTAGAAPMADQPGGKDTILVVIQLTGGNDGLNTVIPFDDPEYVKLRPTLKIPSSRVLKIDDSIGLHPSMSGLHELLQDGALSIVQGVGYPNPSQSHFRSMDIWQAADTAAKLTTGWLGRSLNQVKVPAFHIANGNEPAPLALDGAPARVPSLTSLSEFQLRTGAASTADRRQQQMLIEQAATISPAEEKPDLLDFVRRTATHTYDSTKRVREIGQTYEPKVPYPTNGLADRLKLAAQLIDADLGARLFYVSLGNFDTHSTQANTHAQLLEQLSSAVTAFYRDLAGRGHAKRLMIMTFSEFGRRPYENGSRGTDHGTAAPMLLVGGSVRPGLIGEHPSLTDRVDGNLKHSIDFRQVYAGMLDQWLEVDSTKVLEKRYDPIDVLA